jgi:hypothetical protein
MRTRLSSLILSASALALLVPVGSAQSASEIEFGETVDVFAGDGLCSDPRFEGQGMAEDLTEAGQLSDSEDCQALFEEGEIKLTGASPDTDDTPEIAEKADLAIPTEDDADSDTAVVEADAARTDDIEAGDESEIEPSPEGGEAEDKSGENAGPGKDPEAGDAVDADAAGTEDAQPFEDESASSSLTVDPVESTESPVPDEAALEIANFDFGDDDSEYSHDGECDDGRFVGEDMTTSDLLPGDVGHDATDCRAGIENGTLQIRGEDDVPLDEAITDPEDIDPASLDSTASDGVIFNGIKFGDDGGRWANDGECDDPRFEGEGMTDTRLLSEDAMHDATDCLAAWKTGKLMLARD